MSALGGGSAGIRVAMLGIALLVALAAVGLVLRGRSEPEREADRLAELGYRVTSGAAPGYVEDRACELCHSEIATSYSEVAMSKSFYRPAAEREIEDFEAGPYFHAPSRDYYRMERRDGGYVLRRWQLDADGEPIHAHEQRVDWILGSGNHSRTYIYRTPGGELYQLPLAWYAQTAEWAMAPGYDRPDHEGFTRRVRQECMFCHNAYPEVPAGSDGGWVHVFPSELPQGIGCQRCHGPGAAHSHLALTGDFEPAALRATIVNPAKLPPRLRDDVCYECHMQPSVALSGVRRFDRGDYSFRPGQALAEYVVAVDPLEEGRPRSERFEINHHPYRLEQSRCFVASAGRLSCLTCHDPHRKVPRDQRTAHYRSKCLGCHRLAETAAHAAQDPGDCVACHMPERRTQDVVRVTMTDHLIRRRPGGPELLAPLEEHTPVLVDMEFLDPDSAPRGALGEMYRAAAVIQAGGGNSAGAVRRLEELLTAEPRPEVEPYLYLAMGQLRQRRIDEIEATFDRIFELAPAHPTGLMWLGLVRSGFGRQDEAVRLLEEAVAAAPEMAEAHFNLGVLLHESGRPAAAEPAFQRALALRPNQVLAWYRLARVQAELGRPEEAAASYRRALALESAYARAYLGLGELLLETGARDEALRYLRHGMRVVPDPKPLRELAEAAVREPASGSESGAS